MTQGFWLGGLNTCIHPLTLSFRPAQASPQSSRLRMLPPTAPSFFPSPSGEPRVESPQPRIWAPSASPIFSSGASTCSTRQSSPPHPRTVFPYGPGAWLVPPPQKYPRGVLARQPGTWEWKPAQREAPASLGPSRSCLGRPGAWSRPEGVTAGSLGTMPEPARPKLELRTHQAEVTISRAASTTAGPTNQLPWESRPRPLDRRRAHPPRAGSFRLLQPLRTLGVTPRFGHRFAATSALHGRVFSSPPEFGVLLLLWCCARLQGDLSGPRPHSLSQVVPGFFGQQQELRSRGRAFKFLQRLCPVASPRSAQSLRVQLQSAPTPVPVLIQGTQVALNDCLLPTRPADP